MTLRRTKTEIAARVGGCIVKIEDALAVTQILNAAAVGDELNRLRDIGAQEELRGLEIVFGKQRAQVLLADVAPEAGGGIGVTALSDIVGQELVVIGELA